MYKEFITWLPLLIALLTGGFALVQIRSNNITNSRIRWLENLKHLVSDFSAECAILQMKEGISMGVNERRKSNPTNKDIQSQYDRINESTVDVLRNIELKYNLIILNLNPLEDLHQQFEKILEDYMDLFNQIPKNKTPVEYVGLIRLMKPYSDALTQLTRYILKLEWEKTKRSYLSKQFYMKLGKGKIIKRKALELKVSN
ncbi:MAG TPA: hypothetical protein VL125_11955 [Pelobium sp.]|nr:hypothetical protein [Pelobium sp.]